MRLFFPIALVSAILLCLHCYVVQRNVWENKLGNPVAAPAGSYSALVTEFRFSLKDSLEVEVLSSRNSPSPVEAVTSIKLGDFETHPCVHVIQFGGVFRSAKLLEGSEAQIELSLLTRHFENRTIVVRISPDGIEVVSDTHTQILQPFSKGIL